MVFAPLTADTCTSYTHRLYHYHHLHFPFVVGDIGDDEGDVLLSVSAERCAVLILARIDHHALLLFIFIPSHFHIAYFFSIWILEGRFQKKKEI